MEEFMKQKTECVVCFKIFTEPRILPCLHTFCMECVNRVRKRATVTCPYCGVTCDYASVKVDFNAKEMVDMRLKQEELAKKNEPQKRSRRQHLENYCKDLDLIIEDFKSSKQKIQAHVSKILEMKTSALKMSNQLREKCVAHIHNQFDDVDVKIVETCREKSLEAERTANEIDKRIDVQEQELAKSRELLDMESCSAVTMDYIRELSEKLHKLSEKPEMPSDVMNMEPMLNKDWENSQAVSLYLPKQDAADNTDEDSDEDSGSEIRMMDLTRKDFKLLQEKHLEHAPNSVRCVHGGIWVCSDHGISVHADEIHGLEEIQRIQNEEFGRRIFDVAGLPNDQVVVATEKGLYILYISGQIMKKLSGSRHTSVKLHLGTSLIAVGELETSALAVLYTYKQTDGQWRRDGMVYLPETCHRGHYITLETSDALIYVCNANANKIYLLTWSGDVISEHGVKNAVRMEKEGGFIAYNFNKSIERKHCSYSGLVSEPRICTRDKTGLLIADHDNYRFQIFDDKKKWYTVKMFPLACVGAVFINRKLFVVCRFNNVQLGMAKYDIMKNCLQLYNII